MRRDKKKDLILDFTSLLDVVMLLLFFFILFSRFDVKNAQTAADDAKAEAAAQIALAEAEAREKTEEAKKSKARYDDLIKENTELQERLEHNIRIVDQVTSQEADEIVAFNSGNNLKLILTEADTAKIPMTLKAVLDQKVIGECLVTEEEDGEEGGEFRPSDRDKPEEDGQSGRRDPDAEGEKGRHAVAGQEQGNEGRDAGDSRHRKGEPDRPEGDDDGP